ncbi:uncharacterized protein LOC129092013 [Anoplopoma fimbria]|uniref:uncharacterized protein LOC129092013 n=1 Tax=Anoplopoma fimbria TaxID=229290 RepID=UPI0023EBC664|nr:uncharacterized protein LOC129092013 [Anoplopoma fimbria]
MATWVPASQLLLIALLSWNVLSFPAKKGWSQRDPYEVSWSNMESLPANSYRSSLGALAQPSVVSYPAVEDRVYYSPVAYPASSSLTPEKSSEASWNAPPPVWDPVEESTTTSRKSPPTPDIGLPPPPFYQAGTLDHYEANFDNGNRETEDLNFPAPPLPYPGFQAGALSQFTSILENGNEERETEEQGFMPPPPYASAPQGDKVFAVSPTIPAQPVPQALRPVRRSQFYLFLTGQLPPGTYTHFKSDYETGKDHSDEVHYEIYKFPTQAQQTQDYIKA